VLNQKTTYLLWSRSALYTPSTSRSLLTQAVPARGQLCQLSHQSTMAPGLSGQMRPKMGW
jgi:hypothetical protein